MSPTAGHRHDGWRRAAAPQRRGPAARVVSWRALLRTLQRWWAKERYRPERRYMRG